MSPTRKVSSKLRVDVIDVILVRSAPLLHLGHGGPGAGEKEERQDGEVSSDTPSSSSTNTE